MGKTVIIGERGTQNRYQFDINCLLVELVKSKVEENGGWGNFPCLAGRLFSSICAAADDGE